MKVKNNYLYYIETLNEIVLVKIMGQTISLETDIGFFIFHDENLTRRIRAENLVEIGKLSNN